MLHPPHCSASICQLPLCVSLAHLTLSLFSLHPLFPFPDLLRFLLSVSTFLAKSQISWCSNGSSLWLIHFVIQHLPLTFSACVVPLCQATLWTCDTVDIVMQYCGLNLNHRIMHCSLPTLLIPSVILIKALGPSLSPVRTHSGRCSWQKATLREDCSRVS